MQNKKQLKFSRKLMKNQDDVKKLFEYNRGFTGWLKDQGIPIDEWLNGTPTENIDDLSNVIDIKGYFK